MEIYEKINYLIKERKITKRKFSEILRNLEPKLKSTGESPTEKTIYKYLSGDINIPIELISYIAEVFNITEQELFDTSSNTKIKLYKYISKNLDEEQLSYIKHLSTNASTINDVSTQYGKKQELIPHSKKEIEKLISLLEYAPQPMILQFIKKLEEIKKITLTDI